MERVRIIRPRTHDSEGSVPRGRWNISLKRVTPAEEIFNDQA